MGRGDVDGGERRGNRGTWMVGERIGNKGDVVGGEKRLDSRRQGKKGAHYD